LFQNNDIEMAEKEIALLKEQIERLDDSKFDLGAWKNRTSIFLERIFGRQSQKIKMIHDLNYDYSSWSLRDTFAGGSEKDKDPLRIQARQILEATIAELESLGLPVEKQVQYKVREILEDELTGRQVKEIEILLKSDDPEKTEKVAALLEPVQKQALATILAKLLTS
jgi:hypothetical protein